jgi:glycosyltransferase involved in cell wall biosynthesis
MGHTCFFITGESDRPAQRTQIIPEAHFKHPTIDSISNRAFGGGCRNLELSREVHETTWIIKQQLHEALYLFQLDLIIAENCLTIPMNIPLGLAVVEFVMETNVGCIAHHHDFVWERERFLVNSVEDYLGTAFPPPVSKLQHVVINSRAARDFSRHTGLSCRMIPNVMDFENPPDPTEDHTQRFRRAIGLTREDLLILQPTRVVPRKGIEHSIELVRRLNDRRCKLVVTHASGDEGDAYARRLRRYAENLDVDIVFADSAIAPERGVTKDGRRSFTIWDSYAAADLVTYPSAYEGFGNAFLEAIYYRRPILANRYAIYRTDIEPCGFRVILMDGFLTDEVVEQAREVLADKHSYRNTADHNYDVARQFFSYARLEAELRALLTKPALSHPGPQSNQEAE